MRVSKKLPSYLRRRASEVLFDDYFNGSDPLYVYNKVRAHWAGRQGVDDGAIFRGTNEINRRMLRKPKSPNTRDVHAERARQYRAARIERELQSIIERGSGK